MSSISGNLEIHGNLIEHPFPELLVEAAANELSGSFRLAHEAQKAIVYLRKGDVVFAVSNARQHRLFEFLLQSGKLSKEKLSEFSNFTNDLEFSQSLIEKGVFSKHEIDGVFAEQIAEILKNVFQWETGEWIFSPLARIRDSIAFAVDMPKILMEAARIRPADYAARFKSFEESFEARAAVPQLNLLPQEAFIFSRFENQILTIHDVRILCGLPDSDVLKSLYILWLGGFIKRKRWNSAFTESKIAAINSARLTLKKDETAGETKPEIKPRPENLPPEKPIEAAAIEIPAAKTEPALSVKEYLDQVEAAENHYETLNVAIDAPIALIKTAYFTLAKNFHPDRYHQESDHALQQRIQNAFTELAKAYEILKTTETRQVYDYKLRKFLESGAPVKKESQVKNLSGEDQAKAEFEEGFSLLMNENFEEAIPFLTRAVQLAPVNARYHAYFGKALSADEKQRFKADAEFQTAIRLEPNNASFRLLLAEFYIQYNLLKRAEGELHRLLAISPNNKEAQTLLDTLAKK